MRMGQPYYRLYRTAPHLGQIKTQRSGGCVIKCPPSPMARPRRKRTRLRTSVPLVAFSFGGYLIYVFKGIGTGFTWKIVLTLSVLTLH